MARRRRLVKLKHKKQTVYSVFSLGFFALAVLLVVATFYPQGFLARLDSVFSLYFGWGRVLFAVTLIQLGLAFAKVKIGIAKLNSLLGYFFIFLALMGLSQTGTMGNLI